jgi:excisionase family DNA binding protein
MSCYLTIPEVAERMRCEHRTVRRAIRRGELEAAMIGGRWLVREVAVEAWFELRKRATVSAPFATEAVVARRRPASMVGDWPGSVARLQAINGSKR